MKKNERIPKNNLKTGLTVVLLLESDFGIDWLFVFMNRILLTERTES